VAVATGMYLSPLHPVFVCPQVRPAPDSYFTHSVVQRQAGHSVESLRRSAPTLTVGTRRHTSCAGSGNPGPGDYAVPKDALLQASSPCFTFKGVAAKVGSTGVPCRMQVWCSGAVLCAATAGALCGPWCCGGFVHFVMHHDS
jgi:hypothetical protein